LPSGTIVHIVGARPNFMKAAPIIDALAATGCRQTLVHTGQHYDAAMSDVFFSDLGLPQPDVNLGVGSGSHAMQTAAIMVAFEKVLPDLDPALVAVYGDVNSTLATALVAAKAGVPLAHVEAGLRSFDRTMPEEINRIVTDHLSELLFVTAPEGLENLAAEGITGGTVHFVGNPMIDTLLRQVGRFDAPDARRRFGIEGPYAVATIHRPSNVDEPAAARRITAMLNDLSGLLPVVLPLHPRGRAALAQAGLRAHAGLVTTEPLGYVEFMSLVSGSTLVVTDSGGVQEETTVLGIPCLTVRPNTERPVTITHGTNRLVEPGDVAGAVAGILSGSWTPPTARPPLWDGHAGPRIASVIAEAAGCASTGGARSSAG
jgi:UDP-N-acetylglucosamine 2-epimerase (non-hydrolysing)